MSPEASPTSLPPRTRVAPYHKTDSYSSEEDDEKPSSSNKKRIRSTPRRHLSCEGCRIKKMKCSRTYPCASCRIRNEKCVWEGAIPNGIADEDELEASQTEITRLRKLVGLLVARIDDKEGNRRSSSSSHSHSQSQATSSTYTPYYPPPRNYQQQPYAPYAQVAEGEQTYPVAYPGGPTMRPGARGPEYQRYDEREMGRRVERGEERGEERE